MPIHKMLNLENKEYSKAKQLHDNFKRIRKFKNSERRYNK